jgi:hypothetical protein
VVFTRRDRVVDEVLFESWVQGLPGQLRIGHCFFHFCQALFGCTTRHYKVLHLGVYVKVYKTMALAFLRPNRMQECLLAIRAQYAAFPALHDNQILQCLNLDPWFDYVLNCYVRNGTTAAPRED